MRSGFVQSAFVGACASAMVAASVWAGPKITVGPIQSSADAVSAIKSGHQSSSEASGKNFMAVQASILSNPALMADIQAIASDPEIIGIIADPAFLQAVQARNMSAVQADPKAAQLMANPKIRSLIEKIQASLGESKGDGK